MRTPRQARWRGRGFVEVHPRYRTLLREHHLTDVEHFLALSGVIVSGHAERHVSRLQLRDDGRPFTAYLKREQRVSWKVRLTSALAGFGLVSRSVREARILQALQREDIGCPEWLAVGEDAHGRAFLLVRASRMRWTSYRTCAASSPPGTVANWPAASAAPSLASTRPG